jgi:opacity protein-like surface antigen
MSAQTSMNLREVPRLTASSALAAIREEIRPNLLDRIIATISLRAVGDVGGGYGTVPVVFSSILGSEKLNVNTSLHTYLFGPRASVSVGRLRPFGQALFGSAHQSVSANAFISNVTQRDNAFAFDLGGGVDFRLVSRVAWRVQADYLQTKVFDSTQHDPRISTGIVLRF